MARKRNLFLYNIQPFLKRSKRLRFLALFLLGLILTLFPWFPGSAWELATRGSASSCPSCQMSGSTVAGGRASGLAFPGRPWEREKLEKAQDLNQQGQQGSQLLAMGKAEADLATWKKAEELYRGAGNTIGIIGSQINQAQALEALGHYRKSCDRILLAFGSDIIKCDKLTKDNLEEVLAKFQVADDSLNFMGLQSLGNILRKIGKLEESQFVLMESKDKARSREEESQVLLSLGNTTRALWNRFKNLKEDEAKKNAYNYKREALGYYQEAARKTTSERTNIQAQLNELSLEMREEKLPSSSNIRTLLSEIQSQVERLPQSKIGVYARINLACSLIGCDRPSEASGRKENYLLPIDDIEELLNTAIEDAKSLGDTRTKSHAMGTLGMLYEQRGKLLEAKSMTGKALNLAMVNNAPDIAYQWQWQMGRLLKQEGDVQGAIGHYKAAFNILQELRGDLAAFDQEAQFDFKEKREPVYRELIKLLLRAETPSQENLKQAREVIEGLQLAELDNFFREACVDAEPKQIDQIDKTAAVIDTIILPDCLEVILSLPDGSLEHYRSMISESSLKTIVTILRKNLEAKTSEQSVLSASQNVYKWLLQPAEAVLNKSSVKTLVFVLDGPLRNLSMAALHDGKHYLVENYRIALIPGLGLLDSQKISLEKMRVLAAGRSTFEPDLPPVAGKNNLPNVEKELDKISQEVPTKQLLEDAFTSTNLREEIKSSTFQVVHIATHGEFSSNANDTFFISWEEKININQLEPLLRVSNSSRLRNIELLVLSACETAKGDERAALGMAGVAIRAGTPSTVATLWVVFDPSTEALMARFYQELKNPAVGKAEALRRAQLYLLKKTEFDNPHYWAPFVLVGNWL